MEFEESFGEVHSHPIAVRPLNLIVIKVEGDTFRRAKLQSRVGSVKVADGILAHSSNFWSETITRLVSCTHGFPAALYTMVQRGLWYECDSH